MRKTEAFTIIEIIVVLLISSVVIALGFRIYLNIEKIFSGIISDGAQYNQILFYHNRLRSDFDKAKYINAELDELVIHKENESTVTYKFYDDYLIVETNSISDTLEVRIENYNYAFLSANTNLVTNLTINFKFSERILPFIFEKKYSNKVFFEQRNILLKEIENY